MLSEDQKQKVVDNLKLVDYIIQHSMHISLTNPEYEDYQQEGRLGLILAVSRYDESKGIAFSTYASSYIIGYVRKYRRDFVYGRIKVSRNIKDLIRRISNLYYQDYTHEEIKEELDITDEEYTGVITLLTISSVNDTIGRDKEGEEYTLQDILGMEDKNLVDILGEERVVECIDKVANTLKKDIYKNIWYDYIYPTYFGEKVGQTELESKYGVSQAHISRLLRNCKNLLKDYLKEC